MEIDWLFKGTSKLNWSVKAVKLQMYEFLLIIVLFNGVKQGGVISPILFNTYMDELSIALNIFLIKTFCSNLYCALM